MNICVCISGQVRGDFSALRAIKDALDRYQTTYVISIWDTVGYKESGAFNYSQLSRIFPDSVARSIPCDLWDNDFVDISSGFYEKLRSTVLPIKKSDIRDIFPESLIDIEEDILDLEFDENVIDRNSKKMLYKIWRANKIKQKIERKRSEKFDFVMRIRPDLNLDYRIHDIINGAKSGSIYANYFDRNETGDTFALSSSEIMDIYSSLYLKSENNRSGKWNGIHHELTSILRGNEIEIVAVPHLLPHLSDQRIPIQEFQNYLFQLAPTLSPGRKLAVEQISVSIDLAQGNRNSAHNFISRIDDVLYEDIFSISTILKSICNDDLSKKFDVSFGILYSVVMSKRTGRDKFSRRHIIRDALEASISLGYDLIFDSVEFEIFENCTDCFPNIKNKLCPILDLGGGWEESTRIFAKTIFSDADFMRYASAVYWRANLFDKSLILAESALNRDKHNKDYIQHCMYVYNSLGQYEKSISLIDGIDVDLNKDKTIKERVGTCWRLWSAEMHRSGNLEKSLEYAENAIKTDPTSSDYKNHYLFIKERYSESLKHQ